jgi:hypothetical protein
MGPSCHRLYNSCLIVYLIFLTPCDAGSKGGTARTNKGPRCLHLDYSCLVVCLILTLCDAGSMEALTEQAEAQAATGCTILVLLFTLFFKPLQCRQHRGSARANRGPSCHPCTILVSLFTLFLTLCKAGSMEALPEQTEAKAAITCTILVLLLTLFFNPL